MNTNYCLSTVTPVYKGEKTLINLIISMHQLKNNLERSNCINLVEAIFVDDGSVDGSRSILKDFSEKFEWVKVVELSRNFGQHPATIAGILHTCGDWVVTLDEDLQHDPAFIIDMLKIIPDSNYDIVYASPERPIHRSFFRDSSSKVFKNFISFLSGNSNVPKFNSFRLLRGSIARAAAAVASHQTYFDLALGWFTTRIGTLSLPMEDSRYVEDGGSGYSVRKLLSHGKRMIQSSEIRVVRLGALLGLVSMVLAIGSSIYIVLLKVFSERVISVAGWTSVMVTLLFIGGLILLLIGLMLENISVLLFHHHGKPTYFEVNRNNDNVLKKLF